MASSKVMRAGRWLWGCDEDNNAGSWKDHWACGARSRLSYSTEKEATKAAYPHSHKNGHAVTVFCIQPWPPRRRARKIRR